MSSTAIRYLRRAQRYRDLVIEQARDAVVLFGHKHHGRDGDRLLKIVRTAGLREDRAAFAAAFGKDQNGAFVLKELGDFIS